MGIKSAEEYHKVLKYFPPIPEPAFESPEMMKRVWDRQWGANSEVGTLRVVMMHRPGDEMKVITADKWDDEVGAIVGENYSWYWRSTVTPDLERMQRQHDNYVKLLRDEGVEVVYLEDVPIENGTQYINTRDQGVAVPGGLIVSRFAPAMRRGEEKAVTKLAAGLGVPIIRTVNGTGTFEGGNFAFIDPKHAAVGCSQRTNREGIRQIREILDPMGISLTVVPITGYSLHLDGAFTMVDVDKALVNVTKLPYEFIEMLKNDLKLKVIEVHPDDDWFAINCLQLKPGRVILCKGAERTADRLDKEGVEVLQIEYDEVMNGGGGLHCTTLPLMRDYL